MLSLATHEPNFRVLREDVFQQSENKNACRNCGQEGHYAAQCTNAALEKKKDAPVEKKPFIFLDVATLREYLESELDVPQVPFPFSLEQAIDDWVLLIFFVGNDFLPHLPSLEIREGAIDTLLKIWRTELPRMGGYLTNHGQLELSRVQIILDGLAQREDDIFRRRRESTFLTSRVSFLPLISSFVVEERQDQNTKRRKLEAGNGRSGGGGPSPALQLTSAPTAPHPSLPAKPVKNDFAGKADAMGFGNPSIGIDPAAASALGGSNRDIVAQRAAIRLANMNAAELLKSEMGLMPVKASANKLSNSLPPKPVAAPTASAPQPPKTEDNLPGLTENPPPNSSPAMEVDDDSLPGLNTTIPDSTTDAPVKEEAPESPRGHKRPFEEMKKEDAEAEDENDVATEDIEEEEEEQVNTNDTDTAKKLVVRADGSVDQEDTVKSVKLIHWYESRC
jgi:5'-3' exoribonuclease 2